MTISSENSDSTTHPQIPLTPFYHEQLALAAHRRHNASLYKIYLEHRITLPITYVLWVFLGLLGMHRIYMGEKLTGLTQLTVGIVTLSFFIAGIDFWVTAGIAVATYTLMDLFFIPKMVKKANAKIAKDIGVDLSLL